MEAATKASRARKLAPFDYDARQAEAEFLRYNYSRLVKYRSSISCINGHSIKINEPINSIFGTISYNYAHIK